MSPACLEPMEADSELEQIVKYKPRAIGTFAAIERGESACLKSGVVCERMEVMEEQSSAVPATARLLAEPICR